MFLDGFSSEVGGREMAETLQREVAHVGVFMSEKATEEVTGPHLEAGVTIATQGRDTPN